MDGTGEHHSEQGQPDSEDQSYVLPHMHTLNLGPIQQCCWTWVTWQGRAYMGGLGIGRKPKTLSV
jgi:hypothetical protein